MNSEKNEFFKRRFMSARCLTQSRICAKSSAEMGITKKAILGSVGAIFILIISQILSQLAGSGLIILLHVPEWIGTAVAGILYVIFTYFLLKLLAEKILRMELASINIPKPGLHFKWILVGVLLPAVVTCAYLLLPGAMVHNDVDLLLVSSVGVVYTGFAAGFVEEMVFRGVIFSLLAKRWNNKVAIIVPSLLFGVVHVLGMGYSIGSILLVIIAGTMVGVMFSTIVLKTKSVWDSGVVHMLWNVIIVGGFISISHVPDESALYSYMLKSDSFAITGGEFGIESSVISLVGYVLVTVLVLLTGKTNQKATEINA